MAAVMEERQIVRAQARWVHSSARKARLVTDLIRGRSVPEARTILAFSSRAVAQDVEKVLHSAVANAESRPDLHWSGDELVVVAAYADEGPTLKRWRARARGRVARIRKRTCHITIEVESVVAATPGRRAAAPAKAGKATPAKAAKATEAEAVEVDEETTEAPAKKTAKAAKAPAKKATAAKADQDSDKPAKKASTKKAAKAAPAAEEGAE
jgi:large subunit ribosomal protein L22